eukprot:6872906-Alexandrium_andersonii.AAC.1
MPMRRQERRVAARMDQPSIHRPARPIAAAHSVNEVGAASLASASREATIAIAPAIYQAKAGEIR